MKTQDGLAGARQRKSIHEAAKEQGVIVVEFSELPNDPHLLVVLCKMHHTAVQAYVVWYFNKDSEGFSSGVYCDDIFDAAEAYKTRVERYGGTIRKRR